MDERDWLAERFQEHPRLRAVAYRMLGSTSEADDAAQIPRRTSSGAILEIRGAVRPPLESTKLPEPNVVSFRAIGRVHDRRTPPSAAD
jgi:hypothetical protein